MHSGRAMDTWLSMGALDRADDRRRDPDWVAQQWRRPEARLLVVDPTGALASDTAGVAPRSVRPLGDFVQQRHFLLGLVRDTPWFAMERDVTGPTATLRRLAAVLTGVDLELAVGAVALTTWHRLEPHCAHCGHPTHVRSGGSARACPHCGRSHFPRQDPAVIVAVLDADDRILLGRQPAWDTGRISVLAGFVEAGESLEQAVHREMFEEAGVRLREVRYVGSQPWPFPRSLMLGFVARALSPKLTLDQVEIEDARWFSREELHQGLVSGRLLLPGQASIAHRLITAWQARSL